jgi:16S rRNA (cytosine967-C5)-methyltransferase
VLAETSEVVSRVLAGRPDVALEDAAPLFAGVPELHAEGARLPGTVQLWPHRQGTDAMFFALLRRHVER